MDKDRVDSIIDICISISFLFEQILSSDNGKCSEAFYWPYDTSTSVTLLAWCYKYRKKKKQAEKRKPNDEREKHRKASSERRLQKRWRHNDTTFFFLLPPYMLFTSMLSSVYRFTIFPFVSRSHSNRRAGVWIKNFWFVFFFLPFGVIFLTKLSIYIYFFPFFFFLCVLLFFSQLHLNPFYCHSLMCAFVFVCLFQFFQFHL